MGLDAFAYAIEVLSKEEELAQLIEYGEIFKKEIELAYWRKDYPLNEWMYSLARSKGDEAQYDNVPIYLEREDIEQLAKHLQWDAIKSQSAFPTTAYEFLEKEREKYMTETQKFIKEARKAFDKGMKVYYIAG